MSWKMINTFKRERVVISPEKVTKQCRKIPNWKDLGKVGIEGYYIKNLSILHERIAVQQKIVIQLHVSH